MTTENQLDRPHQHLDALRIQAEIETADRSPNKRPTWAPAVVLDSELLELCHKLEFFGPDDKSVARLWAVFADPKRKGAAIRSTFSQHALSGVRCRGFEMRAGTSHNGERMTNAMMSADGDWSVGHIWWGHSNISRMRQWANKYELSIGNIRCSLQPSATPRQQAPEQVYACAIQQGRSPEDARHQMDVVRKLNADELARWEERERQKQNADYIETLRKREAKIATWLLKLQQEIGKEEASPDWRYKLATRLTELATQRMLAFVGDPQIERQRGARLTGTCCCCGKLLTDKVSLERGIGPECVQHLATFDLTNLVRLKNEMVAAHPDKGGQHEAFLAAYAKYAEAKAAAEYSLTY